MEEGCKEDEGGKNAVALVDDSDMLMLGYASSSRLGREKSPVDSSLIRDANSFDLFEMCMPLFYRALPPDDGFVRFRGFEIVLYVRY